MAENIDRSQRSSWRRTATALFALLLVTLSIRSAVMALRWDQLALDPDAYRLIAENLCEHGVFSRSEPGATVVPTAFRPPLYPLLLAAIARDGSVTASSVALLQLTLGMLSVLMAWTLARRWALGRWSYLVAALVACDPILLNQSAEVMTETLATFMALASLLALTSLGNTRSWKASLVTGLVLGLATLCRPTFLIWAVLIATWLVVVWRGRTGLQCGVVMLTAMLSVLSPWAIRNHQVTGHVILATTHGGYTLLLGNNPAFYRHLREGNWGSVWDARELLPIVEVATQRPDEANTTGQGSGEHPEIVADQQLYQLARDTIRHDPGMFAYASLVRVLRLWTPLPHQLSDSESFAATTARWSVALWYGVVYLLAAAGVWRLGRQTGLPPWVWGLLCVLALTAVHSVYWSNMRMRAPAMPVIYLALAWACCHGGLRSKCCKVFL